MDMAEKMLQREIIKNFVAIKKKDFKYSGELKRKSYVRARFSVVDSSMVRGTTFLSDEFD